MQLQNRESLPSGWRKITDGLSYAERLAEHGETLAVPKAQAMAAVKRVAAHIGLKAGDMLLLDTLGAFSQVQDWTVGNRPIVWASNAYLMEQTGFSLSALKRHARRLADRGVISFKDSPNGKRWGRRDAEGFITEAYGFDLSPLSARAEEFERLWRAQKAERTLCQRLKRQITVARRVIRARVESAIQDDLRGPWSILMPAFDDLLKQLPRGNSTSEALARLLEQFQQLQSKVENAIQAALQSESSVENHEDPVELIEENTPELTPKEPISEPHIQTTNQLNPVNRNSLNARKKTAPTDSRIDVPTVMRACPEFTTWVRAIGSYLKDWRDLHRAAGHLGPMIGLSDLTWKKAQEQLGPKTAAAALVLTFDKHCAGEITSPNGYLRGMIRKAGAGELHLERSFHGRLAKQAA